MRMELLAPAGDLDAAYAAFHYGADAIYLGLRRFSARAEAANFSLDELSEITAFAHAATPRRSVFVALNTLVMDDELDEAIESLATISAVGVDAVIVQDIGIARLARRHFPGLELHASTQMAIHNPAGALAARAMGFSRVTLARELTRREVEKIVRESGLAVEVFIHGALCYSYSGLCLYSSMLRERSGNRGKCAYPCRDTFEGVGADARYPFSMKDLALTADVLKARDAGVFSFKIEGRKKSALYVAAVTRYYRSLLDKRLSPDAKREAEEDIKTIFSRPWTDLYAKSAFNRSVTDAEVVGHRGAPIGTVQEIVRPGRDAWVRFKTGRRIERHDGIQTDVPGQGRPFGFPVDRLRLAGARGKRPDEVYEAPAHEVIDVLLPREHPEIAVGATLYCSSSQEVKQRYRFPRPKPGAFKVRTPVGVVVEVEAQAVTVCAQVARRPGRAMSATASLEGTFEPSQDAVKADLAIRGAFEKLGDSRFELADYVIRNPVGLFVPISLMNRLRREVMSSLADRMDEESHRNIQVIRTAEAITGHGHDPVKPLWSLKVDRLDHLAALGEDDYRATEEVIVEVQRDPLPALLEALTGLGEALGGRGRIRLSLPILAREWEWSPLEDKVKALSEAGWARWESASLWGQIWLSRSGIATNLTTDWPVYVTNRSAARQVVEMGVERFTLSPDDDRHNIKGLIKQFPDRATIIVYQDTPLFISENCALAAMERTCPADPDCRDSERDWVSGSGENVRLVQQGCRTLLLNQVPFCLSKRLSELREMGARHFRADFINRRYDPAKVRAIWLALRQGDTIRGHEGNFARGMQ